MKKILFIILLCSPVLFSQSLGYNPDGYIGGMSLHVTPYFDWGSMQEVYYNNVTGTAEYPSSFNMFVELVFPLNRKLSVSGFFKFGGADIDFKPVNSVYTYRRFSGHNYQLGATVSVYFGGK